MAHPQLTARLDRIERSQPTAHKRGKGQTNRLGGLLALLTLSAVLFIAVVCWHRDLVRIKRATEGMDQLRQRFTTYFKAEDHLPFQLPERVHQFVGDPELDYPGSGEIYLLTGVGGPYVLISGERQGLLPPREAGCAVIIFDHGKMHTEWISMDRLDQERERRDQLLADLRD